MSDPILQVLVAVAGLVSRLIATYVSLQNRALLAEVRKEIAELESRIFTRIDGSFVRVGECRSDGCASLPAAGTRGGKESPAFCRRFRLDSCASRKARKCMRNW